MSGPAVAVRVLSERRFSVTREVEVIGVFGNHEHEYDSLCGSWLGLTRDGRELHMRGQGARLSRLIVKSRDFQTVTLHLGNTRNKR